MNAIAQASAAPVTGPKLDSRRVVAGIVDLAIVSVGAVVILFAGDALSGDASDVRGALAGVILGWALYYYFALESGGGQTVGKKLMKLRVVRADGSPVGMREVAVRTILRVVDGAGAYIVGLIVMLATGERRQRLGDLAAGTIVIDASSPSFVPAAAVAEPVEEAAPEAPEAETAAEADSEPSAAAGTATITLPARPTPPETLADLVAPEAPEAPEAPAAPEMRPFPPVDAPVEEPVVEEPVIEEPVIEEPVVVEPLTDEPFAGDALPEIASPSVEELALDVAAAQAEPEQAEQAEEIEQAEEVADDEPVTVKSVETVSAIDLIMGGAPEDDQSDEDDPEGSASH